MEEVHTNFKPCFNLLAFSRLKTQEVVLGIISCKLLTWDLTQRKEWSWCLKGATKTWFINNIFMGVETSKLVSPNFNGHNEQSLGTTPRRHRCQRWHGKQMMEEWSSLTTTFLSFRLATWFCVVHWTSQSLCLSSTADWSYYLKLFPSWPVCIDHLCVIYQSGR